jgi:co-chaperonin GroES (HSP10)
VRPLSEQAKGAHVDIPSHRVITVIDGKVAAIEGGEPLTGEPCTFTPPPRAIRPLHDRIYIQKLRVAESKGGIIFPETFKLRKQFSARERLNSVPDLFHAIVLACGPDVRELSQGDEIIVYSFADSDGSKMYTGDSVGEKDRMFIGPDDVVCAVDRSDER